MTSIVIGQTALQSSRLAYGCWRIADDPSQEGIGRQAVLSAIDAGYTLFDHADIYCDGHAETLFGRVLRETPSLRRQILISSKCGIIKPDPKNPKSAYRYDFSKKHILEACEGSLRRLGVETIDLYQLHRPDYLMNPAEVAAAFAELHQAGKVRYFGASNFRPSQITALQSASPAPLSVNQIEISLACTSPFEDGTLDQCLAEKITPLAWSPLAGGQLADGAHRVLPAQEAYQTKATLAELDQLASAYSTNRTALALAWLLHHPSGIVPIVGSTQPERIRQAVKSTELELTDNDWYRLFVAARGQRLP